jgi:hypothetical protein
VRRAFKCFDVEIEIANVEKWCLGGHCHVRSSFDRVQRIHIHRVPERHVCVEY